MPRLLSLFALAAVVAAGLAGCSGPSETVTVTQRPDPIPSTEEPQAAPKPTLTPMPAGFDTVGVPRLGFGKMWPFEHLPLDYLAATYALRPDSAWQRRARLGALRFGSGCSASFVSAHGLVMTNHHCARDAIARVSRPGEALTDAGFYADALADERRAPDLYVEHLVKAEDVTPQVFAAEGGRLGRGGDARASNRARRAEQIAEQMTATAKLRDERLRVEITPLYRGSRYSAYTYRRYDDVRLVMAPEVQLGFFGGAADNFTYPRFALDVAFFRVYDREGEPLAPAHHFAWSRDGAAAGDAVFVVGHPGATSRHHTLAQLAYERGTQLPGDLAVVKRRAALLDAYVKAHPRETAEHDLMNTLFALENTAKARQGRLAGLRDPYLLARRTAAERALQQTIQSADSLRRRYGDTLEEVRQLQQTKRIGADKAQAFAGFASTQVGSRILTRGTYAYFYERLRGQGASSERLADIREDALKARDWPPELEEAFITARLRELQRGFGASDPTMRRLFADRTPEAIAKDLAEASALIDSTAFVAFLDRSFMGSGDAAVPVIRAIAPLFASVTQQQRDLRATEDNLNARLAQARFAAFDRSTLAPDATGTLRLTDGRVRGYAYNGTVAPAFTNFYGLLDHYYSYNLSEWSLPARWLDPPPDFDLATPLNLVATTDIAGGNSGSPLLNRDLEVVGLVFDSNVEALPTEYLYADDAARTVAVDARGILEALDDLYDYDRLTDELLGTFVETEAEADANEAASVTR